MSTKEAAPLNFFTEHQSNLFNKLLPNNWEFVQKSGIRLHTDPYRKVIFIPKNYFTEEGNYFSLTHEIGHAHINEQKEFYEIEEEMYLRDKMNHLGKESLSEQERKKYKTLVIGTEIAAWEYAIKTTYELKQKGFDIEPNLTKKDLLKIAKIKLKSYFLKTLDK